MEFDNTCLIYKTKTIKVLLSTNIKNEVCKYEIYAKDKLGATTKCIYFTDSVMTNNDIKYIADNFLHYIDCTLVIQTEDFDRDIIQKFKNYHIRKNYDNKFIKPFLKSYEKYLLKSK